MGELEETADRVVRNGEKLANIAFVVTTIASFVVRFALREVVEPKDELTKFRETIE